MRTCDMYWHSNKSWWYVNDKYEYAMYDDAPEEAKESFKRWLIQIKLPDEIG